ncbi:MAG TPA: DUF5684 domain-containing protein [Bacteroidia bacterium]|nr:DUF5684 domain-containing protein [Bacteroidia bacterium]
MYDFPVSVILLYFAVIALMIVSMWIIYQKANKPGWASIVPIYNLIVLLEIAGKPWWWIFLFLIPIVNIIFIIMMYNGVSKAFGKSEGFTVGLVLLGIVFLPILAFSSATYIGSGKSNT